MCYQEGGSIYSKRCGVSSANRLYHGASRNKKKTTSDFITNMDFEFLKDSIITHVAARGCKSAQKWVNDFVADLSLPGPVLESLHEKLTHAVEEAEKHYNRPRQTEWLCPYCPDCAREAGEDVVDYLFRAAPFCAKHHVKGVNKK